MLHQNIFNSILVEVPRIFSNISKISLVCAIFALHCFRDKSFPREVDKIELLKYLDINWTHTPRGPFSLLWCRVNPNVTPSYDKSIVRNMINFSREYIYEPMRAIDFNRLVETGLTRQNQGAHLTIEKNKLVFVY